jgi:hypothetical protein
LRRSRSCFVNRLKSPPSISGAHYVAIGARDGNQRGMGRLDAARVRSSDGAMKRHSLSAWMVAASMVIGLASLGGNCDPPKPGATPTGGGAGGPVGATCADVCSCLASACPDYPFAPDCVTACGADPTPAIPAWDLGCRAKECAAAKTDHDTHCPNASGQTMCK